MTFTGLKRHIKEPTYFKKKSYDVAVPTAAEQTKNCLIDDGMIEKNIGNQMLSSPLWAQFYFVA